MISPKDFKEQMLRISRKDDPESKHGEADNLMCEILKELGYNEGTKIFEDMEKWYA